MQLPVFFCKSLSECEYTFGITITVLKISQNRGRHLEFYSHTGIGNWFQCFPVYPGLNLSSGSGSVSGSRSGFRIPAFPYAPASRVSNLILGQIIVSNLTNAHKPNSRINYARLHIKLDIKKQTSNTIITQAYHSRCTENYQVRPQSLQTFQPSYASSKVKNENDAIRNEISDFTKATYFATKNPINKLAMNNRRLLITAEFHFVHSVEKKRLKTSQFDTKLCHLQLLK